MRNEKIFDYNYDDMGGRIIDQWGTYKRNKSDIVEKLKYNNEYTFLKKYLREHTIRLLYIKNKMKKIQKY